MHKQAIPLVTATTLSLFLLACPVDNPVACTAIGCGDGATIDIKRPNSAWEAGSYELTLHIGEKSHTCAFTLPADLPSTGSVLSISCTPLNTFDVPSVAFYQDAVCTEQRHDDAVSESCEPIPERYTMQVSFAGNPSPIGLELTRDGVSLLSRTYTPDYQEVSPNGPQCGPVCSQAQVDETL